MDTDCSKCGTHLAMAWTFCPHCGASIVHAVHPSEHQHHPARGAFGGLYYGLIAAPILIIPGVLLCLLGWGIFLGVPMIMLGIMAPLLGPVLGMGEHKGKCPPELVCAECKNACGVSAVLCSFIRARTVLW